MPQRLLKTWEFFIADKASAYFFIAAQNQVTVHTLQLIAEQFSGGWTLTGMF